MTETQINRFILIDLYCTMPGHSTAIIYNKKGETDDVRIL